MNEVVTTLDPPPQRHSLLATMAARYGVEPDKMLATLKATAFRSDKPVSNEQMMALLIICNKYGLNPWLKEIYAFPDKGGIVPVVGVDGFARIANEHPQFDGLEFQEDPEGAWCECIVYRKDRGHPIKVREYLTECKRSTPAWNSHPRRMLRHRSMTQSIRLAFGFAGVYDPDEAERIIEGQAAPVATPTVGTATERLKAMLAPVEANVVETPVVDEGATVEAEQQAGIDSWLSDNSEPEAAETGAKGRKK